MKEINISQRVQDRLLAVFSHPAWQEGECGELFAENDFRRFEYINTDEGKMTRVALLVKNEAGGWDKVFELVLRESTVGWTSSISVGLAWEEARRGWGEERFYGTDGVRGQGIGIYHTGEEFGEASRHMNEMLFPSEDACPKKIDMEKTVEQFLDQVAGLRLERPVLVGAHGVEPCTSVLSGPRSNQMS